MIVHNVQLIFSSLFSITKNFCFSFYQRFVIYFTFDHAPINEYFGLFQTALIYKIQRSKITDKLINWQTEFIRRIDAVESNNMSAVESHNDHWWLLYNDNYKP